MFYDSINKRCEERGISVSKMLLDIGMSKSTATKWKDNTYEPSNLAKKKIADYFGITVAELMSDSVSGNKKPATNDDELNVYLEELRTRPEMRMLFKLSKGATKEEVEQAVKIIEALRKK